MGAPPTVRGYRLRLSVDLPSGSFEGEVAIDLEVSALPLVLDSDELEITGTRCGDRMVGHQVRLPAQELEIEGVGLGRSTVRVAFRGRATDKGLIGLYESRFGSGKILTTQCAPTGTRRIFPCVDRPDRKAPVELTLDVDAGLTAIFNTPPTSRTVRDGRAIVTFAPTPPMATYLFYLGVGPFELLEGPEERVRVSVFAPPGRSPSGAISIDYARRFLPAFEQYFGIDYPLPKLDLIAVPQYAYGAMENWGAIVFRDMYLLLDAATSTRVRRYALDTIAHEIAHQWFGNLVTMEWWDDIWLNESFATFLEMRIFERLEPSYGSLENYLAYWTPRAFEGDALPHTHPVTSRVDDPSQISQVFDEISYGKGSAILRMIEAYLGEEPFRRGVSAFLDRFRYANATSRDLWAAFDAQGSEPVSPLLETWTRRTGHPFLTVTREGDDLLLRQRRFALDGQHREEHWPIPFLYEVDGKLHRRQLLEPRERIRVPATASYHLNPGAVGFYRVLYDREGYDALRRAGRARSAVDRWIVLHDLRGFLYSGDAPFERFAELLEVEQGASDHLPVRTIAEALRDLALNLGDRNPLAESGRAFLRHQQERLGPHRRPGEVDTEGILRERVLTALAWSSAQEAARVLEDHPDLSKVDGDLRAPVTLARARTGDATVYDDLLRRLNALRSEGESLDFETALAAFPDPALVRRTLGLLTDRTLNRAHLPEIVRQAAANPQGRAPVWEWMQHQLPQIAEETKGTGFASYALEYAIPYIGLRHEAELLPWLRDHPIAEGGRGERKGRGLLGAYLALGRRVSDGPRR